MTERTLRSKILSIRSSESSSNGVRLISEPALLTRTSSPPSAFAASSTTRLASPRFVRSPWMSRHVPPPARIAAATASASALLLIVVERDGRARLGKCLAAAAPMPVLPPVTRMRFPARSSSMAGIRNGRLVEAALSRGTANRATLAGYSDMTFPSRMNEPGGSGHREPIETPPHTLRIHHHLNAWSPH